MKMSFGLDLVQTQKLNLTQELKQSLEILQMNRYELETLIYEEVSENPTLEAEKKDEIDWEKYLKDLRDNTYRVSGSYYESKEDDNSSNPENFIPEKENLYDFLKNQLSFCDVSKEVLCGACYIIRTLDKDGYFREDLSSAAQNAGVSQGTIAKALSIVQSLDPSGVGARSVQECMLIQLEERGITDERLKSMIRDDIQMLGSRKYVDLCKKYGIDNETLKKYIEIIRSLEPRPAREFSEQDSEFVLPDIIVEKQENQFIVRLNYDTVPNLRINNFYKKMLKENQESGTKDYIKEKLNRSLFLMRSVEQRRNTILKVAKEIVEEQKDFFYYGKGHMKSMILRDIAEKTGFHESTISRTVNGKYMMTPRGIFEFKYFFSSGVSGEDGELVSNRNIKERIKELTESENKKKPLSDQKICNILNAEGINISRRTVAKYREDAGILSSGSRKEI